MKKVLILLAVAALIAVTAVSVIAADDYVIFSFDSEDAVKAVANKSLNQISDDEFVDGAYKFLTTGADPYVTLSLKNDARFTAEDYPILKVCFKIIDGVPTKGQFFFAATTEGFKMGDSGTYTDFPIDPSTDDWQSSVVDLDLINGSQWADDITTVRVDPTVDADITVALKYVGFFKDEKAAEAFDIDEYLKNAPAAAEAPKAEETKEEAPAPEEAKEDAPAEEEKAPETADNTAMIVVIMLVSLCSAAVVLKKVTVK